MKKIHANSNERHKVWAQTLQGKATIAACMRAYRQRNRHKAYARTCVRNALRSGTLVKSPCMCGSTNVQAHHHDYSKPLVVLWLCQACHTNIHKLLAQM